MDPYVKISRNCRPPFIERGFIFEKMGLKIKLNFEIDFFKNKYLFENMLFYNFYLLSYYIISATSPDEFPKFVFSKRKPSMNKSYSTFPTFFFSCKITNLPFISYVTKHAV